LHLGLKTSEIDRTDEIIDVLLQSIDKAVSLKKKYKDTIFIIGGDIFESNNPSEHHINKFIMCLNVLFKENIKTYIIAGNHDSIADPNRKSCLGFIHKLKNGPYKNIRLIEDIKCIKWFTSDYGHIYLTFLPHITKAHLHKTKYKTTKDYIDKKCKKIKDKIGQGQQNFVFAHLNVKGVIPGSEENLLKKSEVFLPDCFIMEPEEMGYICPIITNAHIHKTGKKKNICMPGSPTHTDFSDTAEKKYFWVIDVPEYLNEIRKNKKYGKLIRTKCKRFVEKELMITKASQDIMKLIPKGDKNVILKLDVSIAENVIFNWDDIKKELDKKFHYVKPIVPRIIRKRVTRNNKQVMTLTPHEAVKTFILTNKPKNKQKKYNLAKSYLRGLSK